MEMKGQCLLWDFTIINLESPSHMHLNGKRTKSKVRGDDGSSERVESMRISAFRSIGLPSKNLARPSPSQNMGKAILVISYNKGYHVNQWYASHI
ncbi:hypothetical protein OROHE_019122 [Orobanche hederae]